MQHEESQSVPTVEAQIAPARELSPAEMREMILGAGDKPEIRKVFVPEWDFPVYVRGLTATQRDQWEAEQVHMTKGGKVEYRQENIRASLVARCLCTKDGAPVMKKEDVKRLGQKSAGAIDLIYGVAKEISRISKQDEDDMVEALGNDRSGTGSSDWP